jgi:hypothetical protein
MPDYKCFLINTAGRIEIYEVVQSGTDPDAIQQAKEILRAKRLSGCVEVWKRGRLVRRIKHDELT